MLLAAAASALLPSAADAATIAVSTSGSSPNRTLTITPGAGTRIVVSRVNGTQFYVQGYAGDAFSPAAPSGCSAQADALNCGTGIGRIVVNGSSGNDTFSVTPDVTAVVEAHGNAGSDELSGAGGNDQLWGDAGVDTLRGGAGNDTVNAGDGDDFVLGELGVDTVDGGAGSDVLFGGGQTGDTVTYAARTAPVAVNLADGTGGGAGEADSLSGFTTVLGGAGADTLAGGDGNDRLDGNAGADTLNGAGGDDTLNGGNGDDALSGDAGADTLSGGNDADFLDTRDTAADAALACGAGADRLAADPADPATTDCEVIAPTVLGDVSIAGAPAEGTTLSVTFSGQVTGTDSTRSWLWWRCAAADCVQVGEGASYVPTAADAGATLKAVLRAGNDAGTGELASPSLGPVAAAPVAVPAPAARPTPAGLKVRSVRCGGRRCKVTVELTGAYTSLRAVLARGNTTVASTAKRKLAARVSFRVSAKQTLRSGTYRLKVTVKGADGAARSSTRRIRIRR